VFNGHQACLRREEALPEDFVDSLSGSLHLVLAHRLRFFVAPEGGEFGLTAPPRSGLFAVNRGSGELVGGTADRENPFKRLTLHSFSGYS
jgi:hypothetical protein